MAWAYQERIQRCCPKLRWKTRVDLSTRLPWLRSAQLYRLGVPGKPLLLVKNLAYTLLEGRRIQSAAHIRRLDRNQPLRTRGLNSTHDANHLLRLQTHDRSRLGNDRIHDSRVQTMFRLLPESEPLAPLQLPALVLRRPR